MVHPLIDPIQVAGTSALGLNKITVRMLQDQTSTKVGGDGAVIISAIPGDQGEIDVEVWQTSTLHQQFLAWYNQCKAARDQGDVSVWAGAKVVVWNAVDGSKHIAIGVAPKKIPDKTYEAEAQTITWTLVCADITST